MMSQSESGAEVKFVVTNTLIVRAVQRSVAFYRDVLGATVLHEGEPTFLRLGNIWLTISIGGGPTDDKPEVVASMPSADDQSHVDSLRGIRWSSRPIGSGKTTVEDRSPAMSCSAAK